MENPFFPPTRKLGNFFATEKSRQNSSCLDSILQVHLGCEQQGGGVNAEKQRKTLKKQIFGGGNVSRRCVFFVYLLLYNYDYMLIVFFVFEHI